MLSALGARRHGIRHEKTPSTRERENSYPKTMTKHPDLRHFSVGTSTDFGTALKKNGEVIEVRFLRNKMLFSVSEESQIELT